MEDREPPGNFPGAAGEWCTVAEAARRIGVTEKAIRERIKHGSIEWRPKGNTGREVLVTPEMECNEPSREALGIAPEIAELRVEIARLQEQLAATKAIATAEVEAMRRQLESGLKAMEAGIAARNAVIEELKEGLERAREELQHERSRSNHLTAELAEARKGVVGAAAGGD
jgi:chromosome segregation ATPase